LASRFTRAVQVQSGGRLTAGPGMSAPLTNVEGGKQNEQQGLSSRYIPRKPASPDRPAAPHRPGLAPPRPGAPPLSPPRRDTNPPLADEHVAVYVAGPPRQNGWILALQWQVLLAFTGAVVLTWILLYRYFRDWRGALRPTISGGLAAIWGFGLLQLSGFALN